jgi:hypothetical protein
LYRRENLAAKTKSWIQQNPKAPDTNFNPGERLAEFESAGKIKNSLKYFKYIFLKTQSRGERLLELRMLRKKN